MKNIVILLVIVNVAYFAYRAFLYVPPSVVTTVRSSSPSAESIYLLSENSNNSLRKKELDLVINNPVQAVVDGSQTCAAIGSFSDINSGQDVIDQLNALSISAELKALDVPTGLNDYRVMMPPASSLQGAFRKLRELKSQNIDSYVITQGEDALSISLGVFSTEDAAKKLQASLVSSSYEVVISNIQRLTREYWIFSPEGQNLDLDEANWLTLKENYPEIEKKSLPCVETAD